MVTIWSILQSREKVTVWSNRTHQETAWGQIKGGQALHAPWSLSAIPPSNQRCKTPHHRHNAPNPAGTQFWEHEPANSPFAWQGNKAIFLLHPKLGLQDLIRHRCTEAEFLASNSTKEYFGYGEYMTGNEPHFWSLWFSYCILFLEWLWNAFQLLLASPITLFPNSPHNF